MLKKIAFVLLLPVLIVTYKWWGYDYYSHVIN